MEKFITLDKTNIDNDKKMKNAHLEQRDSQSARVILLIHHTK